MNNESSTTANRKSYDVFLNYAAVIIFPFSIIVLEAVLFHLLMIVSNYLQATTVISIALFGIAFGGLVSFYLLRYSKALVINISAVIFILSIGMSYYSIVRLDNFNFPWLLIFPFFSGSLIVSAVFSRADSHKVYFTDLTASALGVIFPIITVYYIKSENTLLLLSIMPLLYIFMQLFTVKNRGLMVFGQIITFISVVLIILFIVMNITVPRAINSHDFEEKVLPSITKEIEKKIISSAYSKSSDGSRYLLDTTDPDKVMMAKNVLTGTDYYPFVMDLSRNYKPSFSAEKNYKIYTDQLSDYTFLYSRDSLIGRVEFIPKPGFDYYYINKFSFFVRV